jgi:beta-phosphoglucomutase-like phosphatase (HAD superfamily)
LQAQAKLKELEAAMVRHFQQHAERAGLGLELLPGVKALLEALQVRLVVSVSAAVVSTASCQLLFECTAEVLAGRWFCILKLLPGVIALLEALQVRIGSEYCAIW